MYPETKILKQFDQLIDNLSVMKREVLEVEREKPKIKNRAWKELKKMCKRTASLWDNVSAVQEIRNQRQGK